MGVGEGHTEAIIDEVISSVGGLMVANIGSGAAEIIIAK